MPANMFEEALVESGAQKPSNRWWTTLSSFALESLLIVVAIALPMIYTDALSVRYNPHALAAPNTAPPQQELVSHGSVGLSGLHSPQPATVVQNGRRYNFHTVGEDLPAAPACCVSTGAGTSVNLSELMPRGVGPALDVRQTQRPVTVTSHLMEGRLIRRVQPVYPTIAKLTRTQGTVILQAVIGKDGHIQALHVVSGTPLLSRAAEEAVKQWEYRPYLLNGQPVEVETQITVNFSIGG